jgi:Zinc carboxypeptidase
VEEWAAQRPHLLALSEIGRSHEGRPVLLATVTDTGAGEAASKPAVWIDANIHATELTGSAAALHLIRHLLAGHGGDERVTRALQTRTFYIVPRLNPDGAELALATPPAFVRSGVRPWPLPDPQPGLHMSDVDGDGRILYMRLPDPTGHWRRHPDEPRLMVPRAIDDPGGEGCYRLLDEGHVVDYDGELIKVAPAVAGLDFNRNFPYEWRPEHEQEGAGPYPTSEPEIRAAVQAICDRPNIALAVTYHTFSGVHLRSYSDRDDEAFPTADLRALDRIGRGLEAITGYPAVSVYHHFRYEPKSFIRGAFDDWLYDHRGVYAWTTEFWNPRKAAGLEGGLDFIDWFRDHPVEDDLQILRWSDRELGGAGFIDWYPFDHPELGPVELGGWDHHAVFTNVPFPLLEREIAPHSDAAVFLALITPRLEVRSFTAERLEGDVHRVRLVVHNTGWLPPAVSEKAVERKAVRPAEAELALPAGAELVAGESRVDLGHLAGRPAEVSMLGWASGHEPTAERARAEWVVRAPAGTRIEAVARHERAGTCRAELTL